MTTRQHGTIERTEQLVNRVEYHGAARLESVAEAALRALIDMTNAGLEADENKIMFSNQGGSATITVDLPVDACRDDGGIVAVLPRDWPRQLRDQITNAVLDGDVEGVVRLIDEWVLAAITE